MQFLPSMLDRAESDALADRIEQHFDDHGFGLRAVEILGGVSFAGYVGLSVPSFQARFTRCVEIGRRLAADRWSRGYATEAARRALEVGFNDIGLNEIVSFTVPEHLRSVRVMERIGMRYDPADDFDQPRASGALRRHVLYRIRQPVIIGESA